MASPAVARTPVVVLTAIAALVVLPIGGAKAEVGSVPRAAIRVGIRGGRAMAVIAGVGHLRCSVVGQCPTRERPTLRRTSHHQVSLESGEVADGPGRLPGGGSESRSLAVMNRGCLVQRTVGNR